MGKPKPPPPAPISGAARTQAFASTALAVYGSNDTCIGHLIPRRDNYYEAFDCNDNSLGVFASMSTAAAAVSTAVTDTQAPLRPPIDHI
jgi:hypothetical protein